MDFPTIMLVLISYYGFSQASQKTGPLYDGTKYYKLKKGETSGLKVLMNNRTRLSRCPSGLLVIFFMAVIQTAAGISQ